MLTSPQRKRHWMKPTSPSGRIVSAGFGQKQQEQSNRNNGNAPTAGLAEMTSRQNGTSGGLDQPECSCCPYGYHIDRDFVRYAEDVTSGAHSRDLRDLKRARRKNRRPLGGTLGGGENASPVVRDGRRIADHFNSVDDGLPRERSGTVDGSVQGYPRSATLPSGLSLPLSPMPTSGGSTSGMERSGCFSPLETQSLFSDSLENVMSDFEETLTGGGGSRGVRSVGGPTGKASFNYDNLVIRGDKPKPRDPSTNHLASILKPSLDYQDSSRKRDSRRHRNGYSSDHGYAVPTTPNRGDAQEFIRPKYLDVVDPIARMGGRAPLAHSSPRDMGEGGTPEDHFNHVQRAHERELLKLDPELNSSVSSGHYGPGTLSSIGDGEDHGQSRGRVDSFSSMSSLSSFAPRQLENSPRFEKISVGGIRTRDRGAVDYYYESDSALVMSSSVPPSFDYRSKHKHGKDELLSGSNKDYKKQFGNDAADLKFRDRGYSLEHDQPNQRVPSHIDYVNDYKQSGSPDASYNPGEFYSQTGATHNGAESLGTASPGIRRKPPIPNIVVPEEYRGFSGRIASKIDSIAAAIDRGRYLTHSNDGNSPDRNVGFIDSERPTLAGDSGLLVTGSGRAKNQSSSSTELYQSRNAGGSNPNASNGSHEPKQHSSSSVRQQMSESLHEIRDIEAKVKLQHQNDVSYCKPASVGTSPIGSSAQDDVFADPMTLTNDTAQRRSYRSSSQLSDSGVVSKRYHQYNGDPPPKPQRTMSMDVEAPDELENPGRRRPPPPVPSPPVPPPRSWDSFHRQQQLNVQQLSTARLLHQQHLQQHRSASAVPFLHPSSPYSPNSTKYANGGGTRIGSFDYSPSHFARNDLDGPPVIVRNERGVQEINLESFPSVQRTGYAPPLPRRQLSGRADDDYVSDSELAFGGGGYASSTSTKSALGSSRDAASSSRRTMALAGEHDGSFSNIPELRRSKTLLTQHGGTRTVATNKEGLSPDNPPEPPPRFSGRFYALNKAATQSDNEESIKSNRQSEATSMGQDKQRQMGSSSPPAPAKPGRTPSHSDLKSIDQSVSELATMPMLTPSLVDSGAALPMTKREIATMMSPSFFHDASETVDDFKKTADQQRDSGGVASESLQIQSSAGSRAQFVDTMTETLPLTSPQCPDCIERGLKNWTHRGTNPSESTLSTAATDSLTFETNCAECDRYRQELKIARQRPVQITQFVMTEDFVTKSPCNECSDRARLIYTNSASNTIEVSPAVRPKLHHESTFTDLPPPSCHDCQSRAERMFNSIASNTEEKDRLFQPPTADKSLETDRFISHDSAAVGCQSVRIDVRSAESMTENVGRMSVSVDSMSAIDCLAQGSVKHCAVATDMLTINNYATMTDLTGDAIDNMISDKLIAVELGVEEKSKSTADVHVGTEIEWQQLIDRKRIEILREVSPTERPKFSRGIGTSSINYRDNEMNTDAPPAGQGYRNSSFSDGSIQIENSNNNDPKLPILIVSQPTDPTNPGQLQSGTTETSPMSITSRASSISTIDSCIGTESPQIVNMASMTDPVSIRVRVDERHSSVNTEKIPTRNAFAVTDHPERFNRSTDTGIRMRDESVGARPTTVGMATNTSREQLMVSRGASEDRIDVPICDRCSHQLAENEGSQITRMKGGLKGSFRSGPMKSESAPSIDTSFATGDSVCKHCQRSPKEYFTRSTGVGGCSITDQWCDRCHPASGSGLAEDSFGRSFSSASANTNESSLSSLGADEPAVAGQYVPAVNQSVSVAVGEGSVDEESVCLNCRTSSRMISSISSSYHDEEHSIGRSRGSARRRRAAASGEDVEPDSDSGEGEMICEIDDDDFGGSADGESQGDAAQANREGQVDGSDASGGGGFDFTKPKGTRATALSKSAATKKLLMSSSSSEKTPLGYTRRNVSGGARSSTATGNSADSLSLGGSPAGAETSASSSNFKRGVYLSKSMRMDTKKGDHLAYITERPKGWVGKMCGTGSPTVANRKDQKNVGKRSIVTGQNALKGKLELKRGSVGALGTTGDRSVASLEHSRSKSIPIDLQGSPTSKLSLSFSSQSSISTSRTNSSTAGPAEIGEAAGDDPEESAALEEAADTLTPLPSEMAAHWTPRERDEGVSDASYDNPMAYMDDDDEGGNGDHDGSMGGAKSRPLGKLVSNVVEEMPAGNSDKSPVSVSPSISRSSSSETEESIEEGSYDTHGNISDRCEMAGGGKVVKFQMTSQLKETCDILSAQTPDRTSGDQSAYTEDQILNARNYMQHEWLKSAARKSAHPQVVEEFLDALEECGRMLLAEVVNMADSNENTALHYAVSHGNFDVVSVLLDSKVCNINKPNKAGYTPVMLAALCPMRTETDQVVIQRLFQMGDVNVKASQHGQTALMLAVSHGKLETTRLLLDAGAGVNIQDEDGSTALMCAAEHGHKEIVQLLLQHPDIDASVPDNDSSTALSIAVDNGHRDIGVLIYAHLNYARGSSPRLSRFRKLGRNPSSTLAARNFAKPYL